MRPTCDCGGAEYITAPNAYDIYEYVDGEYRHLRQEFIDDEFKLYCRECGAEVIAAEQKDTPRPQAASAVQIDNDRVRVTEWRFAPGAETGWHRHDLDYMVVPQTSGVLLLETAEGTHTADLTAGEPYFRPAGVEHNVVNANARDFVFIEIEIR